MCGVRGVGGSDGGPARGQTATHSWVFGHHGYAPVSGILGQWEGGLRTSFGRGLECLLTSELDLAGKGKSKTDVKADDNRMRSVFSKDTSLSELKAVQVEEETPWETQLGAPRAGGRREATQEFAV